MNQSQILEQVAEIIRDVLDPLNDKGIKIDTETTADQTEGWDSFNHINLIVAVESRFKIKFLTAELESMQTVGQLAEIIQRKLSAQGR